MRNAEFAKFSATLQFGPRRSLSSRDSRPLASELMISPSNSATVSHHPWSWNRNDFELRPAIAALVGVVAGTRSVHLAGDLVSVPI
jgi:hypothetical protein